MESTEQMGWEEVVGRMFFLNLGAREAVGEYYKILGHSPGRHWGG